MEFYIHVIIEEADFKSTEFPGNIITILHTSITVLRTAGKKEKPISALEEPTI